MCVSHIILKYIVLVDLCAASASLGGMLHMSICVISACKSAIVSLYTPALWGTQNSPVLNLVHVLLSAFALNMTVYYISTFTDQTELSL